MLTVFWVCLGLLVLLMVGSGLVANTILFGQSVIDEDEGGK